MIQQILTPKVMDLGYGHSMRGRSCRENTLNDPLTSPTRLKSRSDYKKDELAESFGL